MEEPSLDRFARIVVPLFCPERDTLDNLRGFASQAPVIAVDDGSPQRFDGLLEEADALAGVTLVRLDRNRGMAAALNVGFRLAARSQDVDLVVTFDQDSSARPDHVRRIRSALAGHTVAVAGPRHWNLSEQAVADAPLVLPARTLIQSGTGIPVRTWQTVGPFDERLVTDLVDIDYCLRVRMAGGEVLMLSTLRIGHRLGLGPAASRTFRVGRRSVVATGHSTERRYYINRNSVLLLRQHGRGDPIWAMRHVRSTIVANLLAVTLETNRRDKLRAVASGTLDGLKGRTGSRRSAHPCP